MKRIKLNDKPGKSRDIPCTYLGDLTGDLRKKSCKQPPSIPENWCTHPERITPLVRSGGETFGRCTPAGMSHEFRSKLPIQPCFCCKLYEPKS